MKRSTKRIPADEAFAMRVQRDAETGCWRWTGQLAPRGYARFRRDGFLTGHRWSYNRFIGPIPDGYEIDHVWAWGCRYRDCVNPRHLEAVTKKVNNARGMKARQTHCKRGHEFTPENTRREASTGTRECRACDATRNRIRWRKARGYALTPEDAAWR